MTNASYYQLGIITRTHGVKGNVIIKLDVDDPTKYKNTKAIFLEKDGLFISHKINFSSLSGDLLIVQLEGFDDMDASATLQGSSVFLPLDQLPKLKSNKLYLHEAPGMRVMDTNEGDLGVIEKVYDLPQQPMASVPFHGKELLFPLISAFILRVDLENKVLYVELPEGLVDIYR